MRLSTTSIGIIFMIALASIPHGISAGQTPRPIALTINGNNEATVQQTDEDKSDFPQGAIVFFADDLGESYSLVTGKWGYKKPSFSFDSPHPDSSARGSDSNYFVGKANSPALNLRLRNTTVTKGKSSLLVPSPKAKLLNGKLEFFRQGDTNRKLQLTVLRGATEILRVEIPAGQKYLRWNEVIDLPPELENGLSPGVYRIQYSSADGEKKFPIRVDKKLAQKKLFDLIDPLRLSLGGDHPLSIQCLAEEMLFCNPPLLCDAFVTLKEAENANTSSYLRRLQEHTLKRLRDPGASHEYNYQAPGFLHDSDDQSLKRVADFIDRGQWSKASDACSKILSEQASDSDELSLATMYRAVAKGHSGAPGKTAAIQDFKSALDQISKLSDASMQVRCHSNFGNFYLDASFDGLHRISFDSASVRTPLLSALTDLSKAEEQFQLAEKFATNASQKNNLSLDFARCRFLMAEYARLISSNQKASGEFVKQFISKCEQEAELLLNSTLNKVKDDESPLKPASHELLANILFRSGQFERALNHVDKASEFYVDMGLLPGFESTIRLRATIHEARENTEKSLTDFETAANISLLMQSRFSGESFGRYRSGFLSRRILANSRRVNLLVKQGKAIEALECVEEQKAIALRSLAEKNSAVEQSSSDEIGFSDALAKWPKNTCLLQYHLGPTSSFVFLVDRKGKLQVRPIQDKDGKPVTTVELLGKIQQAWTNIARYKSRHLEAALSSSTPSFDNHWQDELHELFALLIPESCQKEVLNSEHLVIVPHHTLHYFPFAALVAKKDDSVSEERLARPEYLLDRLGSISYAPSLRHQVASQQVKPTVSNIAVFGDDRLESGLAAVHWEIDAAKSNMPDAEVFLATSGGLTVRNALRELATEKMVFFGCHGENETEDPLFSRLVLADGNLLCKEIFESEMASPFVFLSACETALAESSPMASDDLFGLERALMAKGCQTVVSGMWLVDDRRGGRVTSEFLRLFSSGQHDAAKSLADAQRRCISLYQDQDQSVPAFSLFTHPHFWAVFRICGNPLMKWKVKE